MVLVHYRNRLNEAAIISYRLELVHLPRETRAGLIGYGVPAFRSIEDRLVGPGADETDEFDFPHQEGLRGIVPHIADLEFRSK